MPTSFAPPIAFLGASTFFLLVILLHFLKPELDPSWRMLSEYAIGHHGWIMTLAFLSLSTSSLALAAAFFQHGLTTGSLIMGTASIGSVGSTVFITDPITTPWSLVTPTGRMHVYSAAMFILGFPIAVAAIAWNASSHFLLRSTPNLLTSFSLPVWIGVIVFVSTVTRYQAHKRAFGPAIPIGWPNRLMLGTYVLWLMAVSLALWEEF